MDTGLLWLNIAGITVLSLIAYHTYKEERKKYDSQKDFWIFKTQKACIGFNGLLGLIWWNLIIIMAIPIGLIMRLIKWKMKNSKN